MGKKQKQAGAELCQAQVKLGLAKPTVASSPPSQLCYSILAYPLVYQLKLNFKFHFLSVWGWGVIGVKRKLKLSSAQLELSMKKEYVRVIA